MKAGIKFCGFCNPDFDAAALFEQLKSLTPGVTYVSHGDPEASIILYLSGCSKDCAARGAIKEPKIIVGGAKVNYKAVPTAELATRISVELKKFMKGET
ncbi:hypothetical protein [Moorella sp. ACPs]|uniref:hypothetical protein n=1 Tax=Neomoorella carbonis TaxID=3062783 RepID=UPI003252D81A